MNRTVVKIILIVLGLTMLIQCSNKNIKIIELTNISDSNSVQIPFEVDANIIQSEENLLLAISIKNPSIQFLLQRSNFETNNGDFTFSTLLPKNIENGEYKLSAIDRNSIFSLKENGSGNLTVNENENPILAYNFGMQLPKGVHERYRRSTYIHPVYDLQGNILTDDFPDDHYHHRGISWVWPKVFIDSTRYDLWHIYGPNAEYSGIHQVFEKWLVKDVGPISSILGAKNVWKIENGKSVMDEWVNLRIYKTMENARVIDISLKLKAKAKVEIEGQDKKGYGGMNFRFAPRKETIISSEYGEEEDSDLKKLPWADQSAIFGNTDYFAGASIFQKNMNEDFPAGWCLRHYGFLGVAWPGIERYTLNPGDSINLNFRILIHQGTAVEGKVKEHYEVYEHPPAVISKNAEDR